jgi:hypothetical protein
LFLENKRLIQVVEHVLLHDDLAFAGRCASMARSRTKWSLDILAGGAEIDAPAPEASRPIRFFLSNNVLFFEKFIGVLVVFLLIYIALIILFHHLKTFYYGLMSRSIISIGALLVFMLLVISKLLDGIGRKLNR